MAGRKYRGIEIDAKHIDIVKNLDSVQELIDDLRDLQSTWNNLSLLGELTHVGAEISDTRQHFQQLASDMTNFMAEQSTRHAVELLATRAQNSIDILVRNLYERTADIGFLATDPVFTQRCIEARTGPLSDMGLQQIRQRMQYYVSKYSVYKNVILLDSQARTITDMNEQIAVGCRLDWIQKQVSMSSQYLEAFRPLQGDVRGEPNDLIYAWKISSSGQIVGYIALVFNLEEESEALFSKVMGRTHNNHKPEWRVCGVTNAQGDVLISSDSQYVGPNQRIRLPDHTGWGIAQIGPVAYLGCIRTTRGYQGYGGPGWKGFCLVPLNQAFKHADSELENTRPEFDTNKGIIDGRIEGYQQQAFRIQRQLNRSIWNGNMTQRNGSFTLGHSFGKTLLWEMSRAGETTKNLFTQSLEKLVQTEINGFQSEQQARAMLAIDLMDRNLYERANDCRWWALNPTLIHALLNKDDSKALQQASECLKHINSLYTVYTNILLLDKSGKVVCDSASQLERGTSISAGWLKDAMLLKNQSEYCVSKFEISELYQNRPTYIYAAALFENPSKPSQSIGVIALVFDSEPQFEAILNESMGDSQHKAFAFILDEGQRVISSTTNSHTAEGQFTLPLNRAGKFEKQKTDSGYFTTNGQLLAYGSCNSGSYREYKNHDDKYQNNLTCVYGLDLGPLKEVDITPPSEIGFDEFRQAGIQEQTVDIATFRVGSHWYGIDSEDTVEAFLCNQIIGMPNSPNWVLGTTLHKQEAVNIIDISKILDGGANAKNKAEQRQQMILLKTNENKAKVALAVDDLGEIPSLPASCIHESENLHGGQGGTVQGLIKTSTNVLVVLNVEKLLQTLEAFTEKAPSTNKCA